MSSGSSRRRAATALGWVAGFFSGLLLDYLGSMVFGETYPAGYTTFVLLVAGAFAGMAVADRVGEDGVRYLGLAAGILMAATLFVILGAGWLPFGP